MLHEVIVSTMDYNNYEETIKWMEEKDITIVNKKYNRLLKSYDIHTQMTIEQAKETSDYTEPFGIMWNH